MLKSLAQWWRSLIGPDEELERLRGENMRLKQDLAAARLIDAARHADTRSLRAQVERMQNRRMQS